MISPCHAPAEAADDAAEAPTAAGPGDRPGAPAEGGATGRVMPRGGRWHAWHRCTVCLKASVCQCVEAIV